MKNIILLVFGLFSMFCNSQNIDNGELYKIETRKFISDIIKKEHLQNAVLSSLPITEDLKNCFESQFKDSKELTSEEKKTLKNEIDKVDNFEWNENFITDVKIVSGKKVSEAFENPHLGWKNFRYLYGDNLIGFSKPIFLRNYTICVFSYSSSRDYLSGYGLTACYKKVDGVWKRFETACGWDS